MYLISAILYYRLYNCIYIFVNLSLNSEVWWFFPNYHTWCFVDVAAAFLRTCPDLFKTLAEHSSQISHRVTSLAQQQQARAQPACIETLWEGGRGGVKA